MKNFETIDPKRISDNLIHLIADDWMLVSAGNKNKWNAMTASWGGMGCIWGKPSAFIFIRPQRYTLGFLEENDTFSLCFFGPEQRQALNIAGSRSGRDFDKMTGLGLTARDIDGTIFYDEARLVLICKKVYRQDMTPDCFVDDSPIKDFYTAGDYHRMYIGRIIDCMAADKQF